MEDVEGSDQRRRNRLLRGLSTTDFDLRGSTVRFFVNEEDLMTDTLSDHSQEGRRRKSKLKRRSSLVDSLSHKSCLRPGYKLHTQFFLSFGVVALISISFMMLAGLLTVQTAGARINAFASDNLRAWIDSKLILTSRAFADIVHAKSEAVHGVASLLSVVTQERLLGYPNTLRFLNDTQTPFRNHYDSNVNKYPIEANELLPLDVRVVGNVNESNFAELMREHRRDWFPTDQVLNLSAMPSITFQGACVDDTQSPLFDPACQPSQNNMTTGGSRQPTQIFETIHRRVSDYATPLLRSVYEYHGDAKLMGLYLSNDGAGATVRFPAYHRDASSFYTSIGCDWMATPNPYDPTRPIGTPEQIAKCHPANTSVPSNEYNPLERPWCKEQALDPFHLQSFGPYKDAFTPTMLMTFGTSMYDRLTKEFIGCTLVDTSLARMTEAMQAISLIPTGRVALFRWDEEGTVVVADPAHADSNERVVTIDELDPDVHIDRTLFNRMKLDWEEHYQSKAPRRRHQVYRYKEHIVSFVPLPKPPKEFDPEYTPTFMVVVSIQEVVAEVIQDRLEDRVDSETNILTRNVLIAALFGLTVVFGLVYAVSLVLTLPLTWMQEVGDHIISSAGQTSQELVELKPPKIHKYSPKTEVSKLVDQFRKMVKRFSGSGTAKLYKRQVMEVKNPFCLNDAFEPLYEKRNDSRFPYNYQRIASMRSMSEQAVSTPYMPNNKRLFVGGGDERLHWGPNVHTVEENASFHKSLSTLPLNVVEERSPLKSPLFRWILGCITIPLLFTMAVILVYVLVEISLVLPSLINDVLDAYKELETGFLGPTAQLRAHLASDLVGIAVRDLHVLTRFLSWMHFGAIPLSATLPPMMTGTEFCKNFPFNQCPAANDTVCDCKWNDPWTNQCQNYTECPREQQMPTYVVLSEDALPNGDRVNTSYPKVGRFPNETQFYDSLESMPGSSRLTNASGYATTFDRMRVAAASSVIQIPLYNYVVGTTLSLFRPSGTYAGYEADGSLMGYSGCDVTSIYYSYFQSTVDNGAATLAPNLCPLNKYGYDSRCRDWYVTGKKLGLDSGAPLYMSPSYLHATSNVVGTSANMPLLHNGDFIGISVIDVSLQPVIDSLVERTPLSENGFHVFISTQRDNNNANTIVGPGFEFDGTNPTPIEDLLAPGCSHTSGDVGGCRRRADVEEIVRRMENGDFGNTSYYGINGDDNEQVNFAFAPVRVPSFRFVDPTDIDRGTIEYDSLVYSLAVAETETGLIDSFWVRGRRLFNSVYVGLAILTALMLLAFGVMAYVAARVSMSLTHPIGKLLVLVIGINREDIDVDDEFPEIQGGSLEVVQVRETFYQLFMMVRFATTAFYTGDLNGSYKSFQNALLLFTNLRNEKAIGIANNDLGNIMLTMYRTMEKTKVPTLCGLSRAAIVEQGIEFFKSSIDTGEKALAKINEEEGWSIHYLIFMQQLSNRYFNRAMFLLTVRDDHPDPQQAEEQGYMDLATCKDMDREVVDNGDREGFKGDLDEYFELLLSRIRGILTLVKLGFEDEWGLTELFVDAKKALTLALDEPAHPLFRHMEPAGQMQRLDLALMEYYLLPNSTQKDRAAKIAIRMLVEDDYLIGEAATVAIKAVIDGGLDDLGDYGEDRSDIQSKLYSYRHSVTEAMSLHNSKRDALKSASYHSCNSGDFLMEFF